MTIPGYDVIRQDRDNGLGGGTSLEVKKDIEYVQLQTPELDNFEAAAAKIKARGTGT